MTIDCSIFSRWLEGRAWPVIAALSLAACGGGGDGASPVPPATFTALGLVPGYAASQAVAVSADGAVIAGTATTSAGNRQAFRWTAQQGPVGLGFMVGGTHSAAAAIAADGATVLGNGDSTSLPATSAGTFRWTAGAGAIRLESPPNSYLCTGAGMSGDGTAVAGTCLTLHGNEAFRWTGGAAPVGLGVFGGGTGARSSAAAISKDGSTIVGTGNPLLAGVIVWNAAGTATILGKLPGDATAYGSAVTRDGAMVVGTSTDNGQVARGFGWRQATGMVALGAAPSGVTGTFAAGVSGDGAKVVGWGAVGNGEIALVWDAEHGWRTLAAALAADYQTGIPGWQLTRATAISDDGRAIVGYGTNPGGQTEGWLVRLPN